MFNETPRAARGLAAALLVSVSLLLVAPVGLMAAGAIAGALGFKSMSTVAPDEASDSVGFTAAEFRVDESGAATYKIALQGVPGTAGVVPQLSLNYSSQGGEGPVGKGWSVGGVSAVMRCRATREAGDFIVGGVVTDGTPAPVNYTASDRYCLDGQRLIPAPTGSAACLAVSGMTVANLRTEIESFQRVCAYTPSSGTTGVAFFTVERKDGSTSWYGDRVSNASQNLGYNGYVNSTVPGKTGFAMSWAQTRLQDSTGNFVDYVYSRDLDGAVGEHLLREVRYTGKTQLAGQTAPARNPYARIVFNYSLRNVATHVKGYVGGGLVTQAHRLDSITACDSLTVCAEANQARYYQLNYALSPSGSGAETLISLQECRDSSKGVCMPATSFTWSTARTEFVGEGTWNPGAFGSTLKFEGYKMGDINGDGRPDMVWLKDGESGNSCEREYIVAMVGELGSHGEPTFRPLTDQQLCTKTEHLSELGDSSWQLFDYNGDGRDDLFMAGGGANDTWAIYPALDESQPCVASRCVFDMNTNLLATIPIPVRRPPGGQADPRQEHPQLVDFNGDGLLDVLYTRKTGSMVSTHARVMERNGSSWNWGAERQVQVNLPTVPCAAFPDYFCQASDFYALSPGLGNFQLYDFNGDAASDLVYYTDRVITHTYTGPETCVEYDGSEPEGAEPDCSTQFITKSLWIMTTASVTASTVTLDLYSSMPRSGNYAWLETGRNDMFADFNGDNLTDRLARNTGQIYLNTGDGFRGESGAAGEIISIGTVPNVTELVTPDLNGDGRADLAYPKASDDAYVVRYALRGGGFGTESALAGGGATTNCGDDSCFNRHTRFFADLDADGQVDFFRIRWSDDDPHFYAARSSTRNQPRDVITRFTNGLGSQTTVSYAPLTNDDLYRRDTGSRSYNWGRGSPVVDVLMPTYAVSRVSSSSPTSASQGMFATVHYRYAGARMQSGGRGFLGFREIVTIDANQTGGYVSTTTTYHQNFPFIGMPASTVKRAAVGASYTVPACLNSAITNACYSTPGYGFAGYPGQVFSNSTQAWEGDTEFASETEANFTSVAQLPVHVRPAGTAESVADPATGATSSLIDTAFLYGAYGNAVQTTVDNYTGGTRDPLKVITTQTLNTYAADSPTLWRLGRLTQSTVTHKRYNRVDVVRKASFAYNMSGAATGLMTVEEAEAGGPADQHLRKEYTYDDNGNRIVAETCATPATSCSTSITFHPSDIHTVQRYSRTQYDATGRFPVTTFEPFWNGTGAVEKATQTVVSRDIFGAVTEAVDLNGVQVVAVNGTMGRPYYSWKQTMPGATAGDPAAGVESWTTYAWCSAVSCPLEAKYREQVVTEGAPTSWTYYDLLGRPVMKAAQTFNEGVSGKDVAATCTHYNVTGKVHRISNPFFLAGVAGSGGPSVASGTCAVGAQTWTTTAYDVLGRPTQVSAPNVEETGGFAITTVAYSGSTTYSTDARGNTTTQTRNGKGELATVTDAHGLVTTYGYYADGAQYYVQRNAGRGIVQNLFYYDAAGRKIRQNDPDTGQTYFEYNALGEVVAQEDAAGNRVESWYDGRGRTWLRKAMKSDGTVESRAQFDFDTGANGVGQLAAESITGTYDAWIAASVTQPSLKLGFARSYAYDTMGRPTGSTTTVDGVNYSTAAVYDGYSRLWKAQDVSGRWVKTPFNARGQVERVCNSSGAGDQTYSCPADANTYLETLETDVWGHVIKERRGNSAAMDVVRSYKPDTGRVFSICAGNATSCGLMDEGYAWDANGNLHTHQKETRYLEKFTYDDLDRLKTGVVSVGLTQPDKLVQSFEYDALGNMCRKFDGNSAEVYTYAGRAGCGLGDAKNSGYGGGADTVSSPHQVSVLNGSVTYAYDGRGNQTVKDTAFDTYDRTIIYTLDDKAHEAVTKTGARVRFWYGSDGARYKREDGGGTRRTLYMGNVEIVTEGGVTTFKRTIAGVMLQTSTSAVSAATNYYLFHDHLGSLVRITNAAGVVINNMDFLGFGTRRDFNDPNLAASTAPTLTTRGFTGHEMVDGALQIIHMNGRIFDSGMNRFLQADPLIQAPENAQSWNAYTYVFNNPYRYTDPTGMMGQTERQWLAVIVAIVYTYFTWDLQGGAAIVAAAFGGMISGAIATGSLYGAMQGALVGAVTAGIGDWAQTANATMGEVVAVRAIAGGILEVVQGGKFGHGFVAAGLTALAMPAVGNIGNNVVRTVVGALVGGTISAATGGKFVNGAISGAVQAAMGGRKQSEPESESNAMGFDGNLPANAPYATTSNVEDRKLIDKYLKEIYATDRGKELIDMIDARAPVPIDTCRGCGVNQWDPVTDRITIDLDSTPLIGVNGGWEIANTRRVLAHELGHAATRQPDADMPFMLPFNNRMLNVITNENPIMRQLGESERTSY